MYYKPTQQQNKNCKKLQNLLTEIYCKAKIQNNYQSKNKQRQYNY